MPERQDLPNLDHGPQPQTATVEPDWPTEPEGYVFVLDDEA
jgi:hypothetical protein